MGLIDVDALLKHKRKMSGADWCGEFWDEAVLVSDIHKAPIIDAVPLIHGRWILNENLGYDCSHCGKNHSGFHCKSNYCPNCGARMTRDKEGE